MQQRLQKILSAAGICSRRAAERLLSEGKVTVNGLAVPVGASADPETDDIRVSGRKIRMGEKRTYVMLNKPCGYVTTLSDEKGRKTVAELVKDAGVRLYPVGRLDLNSQGLLILTDDGELANRLTHPSHRVNKVYRVSVEGPDIPGALKILRSPMELDGRPLAPVRVEEVSSGNGSAVLLFTIHEGRNRQVRRMCAQAGLNVRSLMRIAEGELRLGDLPSGKWRPLTEREVRSLKGEENTDIHGQ